jgi:hypothetical protein
VDRTCVLTLFIKEAERIVRTLTASQVEKGGSRAAMLLLIGTEHSSHNLSRLHL